MFILSGFFMLTGSQSFAQIFISFEGIKGESAFKEFPSSTQLNSLNWGVKNVPSTRMGGGGAVSGKTEVSELTFTKPRGSASSALQMCVLNGKSVPKAEVRFYKAGGRTQNAYLTITLENVLITNWSISADGSEAPMETFSLVFTKFKTEDATMKPDGTLEKMPAVGWDIQKNIAY